MSIETIKVPDLGGAEAVEVIEICVAVGDEIAAEDSLVVLESDKASMEVPSPAAGIVKSITISEGDSLSEGDAILELEMAGSAESSAAAPEPAAPESDPEPEPEPEPQAAAPADAAATSVESVKAPDLGGAENVDIIEVCVATGDDVDEGDSLIVLETDKASMEVPAPFGGKVVSVAVSEGGTLNLGDEIVQIETIGAEAAPAAEPAPSATEPAPAAATESAAAPVPAPVKAAPAPAPAAQQPAAKGSFYAGPAVRLLAREMGVELSGVSGTGPRGRITKDDLKAHVKKALTEKAAAPAGGSAIPAVPAVDFGKFGEVSLSPLSKIDKLTATNMQRSWLNVPHVTQFDDADITDLEDFRKSIKAEGEKRGVKVTPVAFLIKAVASALQANPRFNTSLHADGENLVQKHYYHVGMAVDTPNGLVVPVLRDVDKKSIFEIAADVTEMAQKAKDRKLSPNDMQGACFTISSLGGIGGQGFTPIVNTPEVGILGVSKLSIKPQWNGSEFVPRKMLPLSLSYDHKVINGGDAGRFLTYLTEVLADIRRLVL